IQSCVSGEPLSTGLSVAALFLPLTLSPALPADARPTSRIRVCRRGKDRVGAPPAPTLLGLPTIHVTLESEGRSYEQIAYICT
ncbi:hypothetical protein KAF25_006329, partial [Fusarium avenaceum]